MSDQIYDRVINRLSLIATPVLLSAVAAFLWMFLTETKEGIKEVQTNQQNEQLINRDIQKDVSQIKLNIEDLKEQGEQTGKRALANEYEIKQIKRYQVDINQILTKKSNDK